MKQIILILAIVLLSVNAYAAQTTVNTSSDTFKTAADRQQAMNTEVYAQYPTQWTSGEVYVADTQIVTHGGNLFICILGHTASAAGATGDEPGVGDAWTTYWKYSGADRYEPLKGADDNYVTDAEKVVIGNTSGTNTGDEISDATGGAEPGANLVTWSAQKLVDEFAARGASFLTADAESGLSGNTVFSSSVVVGAFDSGTCSGYLKSDGSCDTPTGTGDMVLATEQTVTGLKTFDTLKLAVKGTSTGINIFESTNPGATNYTLTLPNADGTLARISEIPSVLQTVRSTASGGSTIAVPSEAAVGDAIPVAGTDFNAYDADITTYAGITPSANVQSVLGAVDHAAIRTLLSLDAAALLGANNGTIGDVAVWIGVCSDTQYTDQSTCETNLETWSAALPVDVAGSAIADAGGYYTTDTIEEALQSAGAGGLSAYEPADATISNTVASGTATLGTTAIADGDCATVVTVAASGVVTTDVIDPGYQGTPVGTTGYDPTAASLSIIPYPTADNVHFLVCNTTGASITPGALTINWRVDR